MLYISWVIAIIATTGSLYFSEIRNFTPCVLCWYQRIFMYPLVIIIPIGILAKDQKIYLYVLTLSILGGLTAFYQVLLQSAILPENITPCLSGISCLTKYVSYFGFITIPFMSMISFIAIIFGMLIFRIYNQEK